MQFPEYRPRRLRKNEGFRSLIRETALSVNEFISPLFIVPGKEVKKPVTSMPGNFQQSADHAIKDVQALQSLGIPAVLLFGIPEKKDEIASGAFAKDGIVQRAVRRIKEKCPDMLVVTDVCLCEYTSHGHCGMLDKGDVDNDATLEVLAETALSHARAGADMIAPSAMMDGQVGAIRRALDAAGHPDTPILSYAAKFASAFYGPFREAAESAPSFGDRRAYQMPPPNAREAMREIELDIREGADLIMVKPALAYLDIIRAARERFDAPLLAYNVSGEYALVKAAAKEGWIDEGRIVREILTAIRRAGADAIITYFAKEYAAEAAAW